MDMYDQKMHERKASYIWPWHVQMPLERKYIEHIMEGRYSCLPDDGVVYCT